MPLKLKLIGQKFERLEVVLEASPNRHGQSQWHCICDCDEPIIVSGFHLMNKHIKSCGCLSKERAREIHTTHGMSNTREFSIWNNMIQRCTNPNAPHYEYYGGRGIQVCDRWLNSFENFFEDIGKIPPGMTLDRFPDNDGNYEPGNWRFATRTMQMNNIRRNHFIECGDKRLTISQWGREIERSPSAIQARMKKTSDLEKILAPRSPISL